MYVVILSHQKKLTFFTSKGIALPKLNQNRLLQYFSINDTLKKPFPTEE